jgi:predicted dehydrogenase
MLNNKCLIIGLGQIGMGYDLELDPYNNVLSHAQAVSLHEKFEISGGVDLSSQRRKIFEDKFQCTAFFNIQDALKVIEPSIIIIATDTNTHHSVLMEVLAYSRPKIILCEKPLSHSLSDATEMVTLCKNNNIDLFVNYIRRSEPGCIEIRKRILQQTIDTPIKGIAWYSKGIYNNGSHLINLLEYWLGKITDFTFIKPGGHWNNVDPEPDFHLDFEHGNVAFQSLWEKSYSHFKIELYSPDGCLIYDNFGESITWQSIINDPVYVDYTKLDNQPIIIPTQMSTYQFHVMDQIYNYQANKPYELCTGTQALNTLIGIDNIIQLREEYLCQI